MQTWARAFAHAHTRARTPTFAHTHTYHPDRTAHRCDSFLFSQCAAGEFGARNWFHTVILQHQLHAELCGEFLANEATR